MSQQSPSSQPFDVQRIGSGLPFAQALDALTAALERGTCVVQAPPGSGKTTLAPPVIANVLAAQGRTGRVIVTGPRRVTVRAAAGRLAHLTHTTVGDVVGYRVRGDVRTSPRTRVEFVTPGVLIRQVLADPELTGVDAVILDEVHERGVDSDVLLGMLSDVRQLRDDLLLVAMSATLDATRFASLLGSDSDHPDEPAPLVDSPSALFDLDVRWAPASTPRLDEFGVSRAFLDHVAHTTAEAVSKLSRQQPDADALVFLPGVREIEHVMAALEPLLPQVHVLPLHGQLDAVHQDAAIGPRTDARPRVIVSTGLAESALTVPGVRLVVDAGLAREPRRDIARDMTGLVTVPASRAAADQRAGRAARLGPGTVIRCYDEQTYLRMPEHTTPEITTTDLTDTALLLAAWGTPGGVGLRLPTAPPQAALQAASRTLAGLGAVSADGRITEVGRTLVSFPADPRLARAMLDGSHLLGAQAAAEVVAALADNPRLSDADLTRWLRQLRSGTGRDGTAARWAREVKRFREVAARTSAEHALAEDASAVALSQTDIPSEFADAIIVALAYPQRVARRVSDGVYQLASGTRATLPSDSPLADAEWLAVAETARSAGRANPSGQGSTGAVIRVAARFTRELAEQCAAHLRTDEVRASWDVSAHQVIGRRVQALGAIEFAATPTKPTPQAAHAAIRDALQEHGLSLLTWDDDATALRSRLAFVHHHLADPWPDVSDTALLERLDDWLAPEIDAIAGGKRASAVRLSEPLRRLLPWPEATRFDDLAPERFTVPSGSRIRLTYPDVETPGEPVILAVKLQECFGLTETPRLADGRAPVLFHLLSPAGRPVAITDDLASFWAGPYAGVRADMRGRYPKHPWPEDPLNHVATAKIKRHLG